MSLTDTAVTEALRAVIDPNTGKDFVSTKQLRNLKVEAGDVSFDVELGYPAKSQIPGLRKALIAAVRALPGVEQRQRQPVLEDHRPRGAARRAAAAHDQEHRRRGVRQGRGGQEHDRLQPGAGAGCRGCACGHPGRRHLRPQPADDDGHRGPAREQRRQDHGAAGELRRAGDVDRLPGGHRQPDDLARPDGHPGAGAVAAPDQLGRAGLPDRGHAARAPATSS
jgi:metal-sulfur cluster biosynthetic enzyme